MESLDTTILNTAVPAIAKALAVAPLSMKSVLASYTLSLAVFIPISGWMADRFGTRRVFSSAIGLFTLGSVLCGISSNIHVLVACRILQGCGGAMMVPVGRLTMVRTFAKSELIRAMSFVAIPGLIGPMLGPLVGGLIVGYFHWRVIFFVNLPIGLLGLYLVYRHLPDYREEHTHPLDVVGLVLFGSGIALLSYVLEVFGEHPSSGLAILGLLALSLLLLAGYGLHAAAAPFPLLRLALFRFRTFRAAVSGSFFTRFGIGGIPFLFPLLYQVGLGFTPIQSGLLMMPQAVAAMSLKIDDAGDSGPLRLPPRLDFQHRHPRPAHSAVCHHRRGHARLAHRGAGLHLWILHLPAISSMNTLVYADVTEEDASSASTIASTMQQMAISFGVASASLATALFIPDRFHSNAPEMIHGIHQAFLVLGGWTILSTFIFRDLKPGDGAAVTQQKVPLPAG